MAEDQYQSAVLFGTVTTSDERRHEVLVKLKLRDELVREQCKCDEQCHNEITMYEKIIPFLLAHRGSADDRDVPSLPRFYGGRNLCGEFAENDLIVLENVIPLGYGLSAERVFLDYDHLLSAVQALAK